MSARPQITARVRVARRGLAFNVPPKPETSVIKYGEPVQPRSQSLRSLWQECVDAPENSVASQQFYDWIRPLVLRIATRVSARWGSRRTEEIDDIAQDIHLKIAEYATRGGGIALPRDDEGVVAYLKAMAVNAARDSMRTRFALKRGEHMTDPLEEHHEVFTRDPNTEGLEREILFKQVDDMLEGSTRERAIFWLYYRQGMTAKEIAAIPAVGLKSKGVESLIYRLTDEVRRKLTANAARLPPSRQKRAAEGGSRGTDQDA